MGIGGGSKDDGRQIDREMTLNRVKFYGLVSQTVAESGTAEVRAQNGRARYKLQAIVLLAVVAQCWLSSFAGALGLG